MTDPVQAVPATSFLDSLGDRGRRRAEPRASIVIAGAGCALAVLGALVVAGDTGASDGEFNRVPGIVLSALIVAAGFFTLTAVRQGAIATAGAAAAALGVPPFMFFLTFKEDGFPPYSTDGILIVSTLVWLAAYAVGPGRGRPFFLGAGLIGFWFTVMQLTEQVFEAPFGLFGMGMSSSRSFSETGGVIGGEGSFDSSGGFDSGGFDAATPMLPDGPSIHMPDPTTLGLICLGFGVAYLLTCRWLDKHGHHGVATPFTVATLPALFAGTLLLGDDLEQAGTGLLALLIGAVLAFHGATVGRRITAWVGGAGTAIGLAVFLGDMTEDATVGGMLFMAGGIALVGLGHAAAVALSEPDEMVVTSAVAAPAMVAASGPSEAPAEAPSPNDDSDWGPPPSAPPPPDPPVPGSAPPPS